MPRLPRIHYHGAVYHVMSRGVEGRDIFLDDGDRSVFLGIIRELKQNPGFNLFAYCLMGNHFHLLIQVRDAPLYSVMHHLLTRYARYFNIKNQRPGHLFQSRYTAPLCRWDSYLLTLLKYIHLNPVRANLIKNPDEWRWSGHRDFTRGATGGLLDLIPIAELRGQTISDLKASYLQLFCSSLDEVQSMPDPGLLGFEPQDVLPLKRIVERVAADFGLSPAEVTGGRRGGAVTRAKLEIIERALRQGHRMTGIAHELKCSAAAVTQLRSRRS